MQFIPGMASLIFSIITPVSHDPSEIILICGNIKQHKFLLLLFFFCMWKPWHVFIRVLWL